MLFCGKIRLIRPPRYTDHDLHRNEAHQTVRNPPGKGRKLKKRNQAERHCHYDNGSVNPLRIADKEASDLPYGLFVFALHMHPRRLWYYPRRSSTPKVFRTEELCSD